MGDGPVAAGAGTVADDVSAFQAAVSFVIDVCEGGGKLIHDQGGATRWGISQRAYPTLNIRDLTRDEAVAVYRMDFWEQVRADALPAPLALAVFDAAVNLGHIPAIKLLQRTVGVQEDGKLGPVTLAAVKRFRTAEIVATFLSARVRWYQELVASKPYHQPSLKGWTTRCLRVAVEAGRWSAKA